MSKNLYLQCYLYHLMSLLCNENDLFYTEHWRGDWNLEWYFSLVLLGISMTSQRLGNNHSCSVCPVTPQSVYRGPQDLIAFLGFILLRDLKGYLWNFYISLIALLRTFFKILYLLYKSRLFAIYSPHTSSYCFETFCFKIKRPLLRLCLWGAYFSITVVYC